MPLSGKNLRYFHSQVLLLMLLFLFVVSVCCMGLFNLPAVQLNTWQTLHRILNCQRQFVWRAFTSTPHFRETCSWRYFFSFFLFFTRCLCGLTLSLRKSPWYDHRGWLGVKQQLSIYFLYVLRLVLAPHSGHSHRKRMRLTSQWRSASLGTGIHTAMF